MRKIIYIFCLFLVPSLGLCTHYYVSDLGSDFSPGTFTLPYKTIGKANSVMTAGDTVDVFAGIYYESVLVKSSGTQSLPIVFRAFPGDYVTIKAQIDYGFKMGENIDYIVIEGFRITDAMGGNTEEHGSGVEVKGNNNIVKNNFLFGNDTGVFVKTFTLDTSITNHCNTVTGNIISDSFEAGIRIKRSNSTTVINNLLYHNGYVIEPAGAITYYGADTTYILNNTFWDNNGPAITNYDGTDPFATPVTRNTLMINNISVRNEGRTLLDIQSNMVDVTANIYRHNLWWNGNPASDFVKWGYNNVGEGGYNLNFESYLDTVAALNPLSGIGEINADPLFENPSLNLLDLLNGSPAFDAGDSTLDGLGFIGLTAAVDQIPDAGIPDLGYHHSPNVYLTNPIVYLDNNIIIYPNPSGEKFKFDLQFKSDNQPLIPTVSIYNTLGHKMAVLYGGADNAQNHYVITWNPGPTVASGVYYALLQVPGFETCRPIIIVK